MTRHCLRTLEELAEELRVKREWLRRQVKAGVIPGRKIAGRWRFTDADVAAALETFAQPATPAPTPDVAPAAGSGVRQLSFTTTTARRVRVAS